MKKLNSMELSALAAAAAKVDADAAAAKQAIDEKNEAARQAEEELRRQAKDGRLVGVFMVTSQDPTGLVARAEASLNSEKSGTVPSGEQLTVLESALIADGKIRLRTPKGWVSMFAQTGHRLMTPSTADEAKVGIDGVSAMAEIAQLREELMQKQAASDDQQHQILALSAQLETVLSVKQHVERESEEKVRVLSKRIAEMEAASDAQRAEASKREAADLTARDALAASQAEALSMAGKLAALEVNAEAAEAARNAMIEEAEPGHETRTFDTPGPLGMGWTKMTEAGGGLVMKLKKVRSGSLAEQSGVVAGWQLVAVNGERVGDQDYHDVIANLKTRRPLTLTMDTRNERPAAAPGDTKVDMRGIFRAHKAELGALQSSNEQLHGMLMQLRESQKTAVSAAAVSAISAKDSDGNVLKLLELGEDLQAKLRSAEAVVAELKRTGAHNEGLMRQSQLDHAAEVATLRAEIEGWIHVAGRVEKSDLQARLQQKKALLAEKEVKVRHSQRMVGVLHDKWRKQVKAKVFSLWCGFFMLFLLILYCFVSFYAVLYRFMLFLC